MDRLQWLESTFDKWMESINDQPHEILLEVDEPLLDKMGLTKTGEFKEKEALDSRYFKVVQRSDKMILYNDQFAIWIVPFEKRGEEAQTYTWVALMDHFSKGLEMGFVAKGKFNSSKLVLRLLEQFLKEIEENEKLLNTYEGGQDEKRG